jgi:Asp-tRNA(Asn)/Glu-tRNA(Gln) amidotransferase A subunit family amidase
VAEASLERIQAIDETLMAFRVVDESLVRSRAKELDEGSFGACAGLTVAVKDVIDTADLPTGYGSPLFPDHQPLEDADCIARLRKAGAIIAGKSESTEFGMFEPTRTRNPYDISRTPGGSSSGSVAAVAAGMVHVALGAQTAGSVIRPAAYCGIYGFKPTRGAVSTRGVWRLAQSLDTLGLFARSVADLRLLYDALRDHPAEVAPPPSRNERPRALVLRCHEWGDTEPSVDDALDLTAQALRSAGWSVAPLTMPTAWTGLPETHKTVMAAEVARNLTVQLGNRIDDISASAGQIVEAGRRTTAPDYLDALAARDEALAFARRLAATADVLLAPSALGVAPIGLEFTGDPVMCRAWSLLGLPASNVPAHTCAGLPVGVQCIGLTNDDDFLRHLSAVEAAISEQELCP